MERKTYYLRLKVLSPIHIGCGEDYEPTGFTVDEERQELIAFEPADFLGQLEQSLLDEYSAICKKGSVESLLDIYKFIRRNKEHARGRTIAISNAFVQHYNKTMNLSGGNIRNQLNRFQIGRTAYQRLNGTPYIPGSSIKGAIRTAVLNLRSRGQAHLRVRNGKELNDALAGGTLDKDPFRLLKVSDFQAVKNISQRIVYGINRKKRPAEKEAARPYHMLEVVEEGTEFVGTISVMAPVPGAEIPSAKVVTFKEIQKALSGFYSVEQKEEQHCLHGINCDADVLANAQLGSNLLRVGRHSGAECVTVAGYRKIKIMQGSSKHTTKKHSTTIWLAAESDKPNTNKFLKPFGWVALSEMSDQEICAFEKDKNIHFDTWETELQQTLIAFREKARELAELRKIQMLERQKAAAEKLAREEELRKYPWRTILSRLETIHNWGALKTEVLEHSDFLQYQNENEVGEAVGATAIRVAAENRKKWDAKRDSIVAEWLRQSETKWQNITLDSPKTDPGISEEESELALKIKSLGDWGQYKNAGIDMAELTYATAQLLAAKFKEWGCAKQRAKKDKKQAWKKLQKQCKEQQMKGSAATTGEKNA